MQREPKSIFLSTLSLRRATSASCSCRSGRPDFYPRSPCGERPAFDVLTISALLISIHALLAESDDATLHCLRVMRISIHALLAESDGVHYDNYNLHVTISIHALLAESDDDLEPSTTRRLTFLSTLSLRRATLGVRMYHTA